MNSLYNNDNFLPEGNRCNFETLQIYGPCQMTYAEPTQYQIEELEEDELMMDEEVLELAVRAVRG